VIHIDNLHPYYEAERFHSVAPNEQDQEDSVTDGSEPLNTTFRDLEESGDMAEESNH